MQIGEKYSQEMRFQTEKNLRNVEPEAQDPVGFLLLK
jgi:hypothetical protein